MIIQSPFFPLPPREIPPSKKAPKELIAASIGSMDCTELEWMGGLFGQSNKNGMMTVFVHPDHFPYLVAFGGHEGCRVRKWAGPSSLCLDGCWQGLETFAQGAPDISGLIQQNLIRSNAMRCFDSSHTRHSSSLLRKC
jgi:hypothetical protein